MTELSFSERFYSAVEETVDTYGMLETGPVLAAFSGGADSTVMLCILSSLCRERGIALHAFHVNHMIRGKEADRDEEFCREFCRVNGIEFASVRIDIPSLAAKEQKGLEETARKYRYAALERCCSENGVKKIATAHNANDNLETILFNIARGSGLAGICGIPPVRGNIIRPLIRASKEDILEFARRADIPYVTDSTNSDPAYSRNRIRMRVIPELQKINSRAIMNAARLSENAAGALSFIDEEAKKHRDTDGVPELLSLHPALLYRVLEQRYKSAGGDSLEAVHIKAITRLMAVGAGESSVSLPGGLCAIIRKGRLGIVPEEEKEDAPAFAHELSKGENVIPETGDCLFLTNDRKSASLFLKEKKNIYKSFIQVEINCDIIDGRIYARSREPGDSYRFRGMTRSVKKLLSASDIDRRQKERLPFLCDRKGILWIPGFPVRDKEKTENEHNNKVVYIIYGSGEFKYV